MSEILVVDDKPEVRKNYSQILEAEGYSVRTASNGDKALEAIYIRKPDLVLLDIDMPRRNGFSTCEEIRKFDQLLPVIFLTGFDTDINELRARGLGADDFFSKSSDRSILLATIRRTLVRSSAIAAQRVESRKFRIGALEVDFDALTIKGDGIDERLTKTEADFLWLLNSARGKIFSYDEIFEVLRGNGFVGDDSILYSHMNRLKRKLGPVSALICNERGVGYYLK